MKDINITSRLMDDDYAIRYFLSCLGRRAIDWTDDECTEAEATRIAEQYYSILQSELLAQKRRTLTWISYEVEKED
jgi:hypothetical protein